MRSLNHVRTIKRMGIGVCSTVLSMALVGVQSTYAETEVTNETPVITVEEGQNETSLETATQNDEAKSETSEAPKVTASEPEGVTDSNEADSDEKETTEENQQDVINLVENGDFSQVKEASGTWTTQGAQGWDNPWFPATTVRENGTVQVIGEQLVIQADDTLRVAVAQTITVEPETQYQLSYDIQTENVVGSGARVRLRSLDEQGRGLTPEVVVFSDYVNGTQTKQVVLDFVTPEISQKLKVELFFENSRGKAIFDNVSVTKKELEEETLEEVEPIDPETGQIELSLAKAYVTALSDHTYKVEDSNIAHIDNDVLRPIQEGNTAVSILNNEGEKVSEFQLVVTPHETTVFDTVRERWEDISLANGRYDDEQEQMRLFLERLDAGVEQSLTQWVPQKANRQTIFQDINFSRSADLTTAYRRLEQMAQVYENPHSNYYHSREVLDIVRDGMQWMYTQHYNETKDIVGNWWDYEIGTPRAVVNTLIYLYPYFSQEEIMQYTQPIGKFVPDTTMIRMTTSPVPAVGGNQTDISKVAILEGALREDAKRIQQGVYGLTTIMHFVTEGEGFYEDGSFIDHTDVAYTGAYGNVLIDGFSQLLPVIQPTEFALEDEQVEIIYQWIEKAFMPIVVKGELMDMTRGRSISRATGESHVQAVEILRALLRIAESSDEAHRVKLQSFVKGQVLSDTYYNAFNNLKSYKDIDMLLSVLNDSTIPAYQPESYIAAFNNMDKFVYHNAEDDFALAISMYSSRTQNYEFMNNENKRGWYTSDGMVYLYNGDLAHYSQGYWPTVNPYFLPGTTVATVGRRDGSGQVNLPSDFVGAVKLSDKIALVAMDFDNWNGTVSERKAWVILGDKVVFLGTDVTHNVEAGAHHTIENRKLREDVPYQLYLNNAVADLSGDIQTHTVSSAYLTNGEAKESIGYVFLEPMNVNVLRNQRTGAWADINSNQSADQLTHAYWMMWADMPQTGGDYAYVMVPNQTLEDTLSTAETVKVTTQQRETQVVYDEKLDVYAIVKYTDDEYDFNSLATLKSAGLYLIQKVDDHYQIAYYDPTQAVAQPIIEINNATHTLNLTQGASGANSSVIYQLEKNSNEQVKETPPSNDVSEDQDDNTNNNDTTGDEDSSSPTEKIDDETETVRVDEEASNKSNETQDSDQIAPHDGLSQPNENTTKQTDAKSVNKENEPDTVSENEESTLQKTKVYSTQHHKQSGLPATGEIGTKFGWLGLALGVLGGYMGLGIKKKEENR